MDYSTEYRFEGRTETFEQDKSHEIHAGNACTECGCNYFKPDRDEDSTGFTCKCGHMKSAHWR